LRSIPSRGEAGVNASSATPPRRWTHALGPIAHVLLALGWGSMQARLFLFASASGLAVFFSGKSLPEYELLGYLFIAIACLPRFVFSFVPALAIPFAVLLVHTRSAIDRCIEVNGIDPGNSTGQALLEARGYCGLLLVDAGLIVTWWLAVLLIRHRPVAGFGFVVKWWA
jgi:hypothetical protein